MGRGRWAGIALAAVVSGCGGDGVPQIDARPASSAAPTRPLELAVARSVTGNPPRRDLLAFGLDGRLLRTIAAGAYPWASAASWSPDGARIAFTAGSGEDAPGPDPTDVAITDADGSDIRRLTTSGRAGAPLWSPDGRLLVYAQFAAGGGFPPRTALHAIDPGGGAARRLLDSGAGTLDVPSSFSPDGSTLLFTRTRWRTEGGFDVTSSVHALELEGLETREALRGAADAAFSPDGEWIAYVTDRDRNGTLNYGDRSFHANELYVARADGSDARRLTTTKSLNERLPAWSPDGGLIAYQRGQQTGNAEAASVLTIRPDGSCARRVAHDRGLAIWYSGPSWRPGLPPDESHLRCRDDAPAAAAPLAGNMTLEQARRFRDFGLWWVGQRFLGYRLSSLELQPQRGARVVHLQYGGFSIQLYPVSIRSPRLIDLEPERRICIRGVEAVFYEGGNRLELVTGKTDVVIFAPGRQIVRIAKALQRLNGRATGKRGDLPPPAPRSGTHRCG